MRTERVLGYGEGGVVVKEWTIDSTPRLESVGDWCRLRVSALAGLRHVAAAQLLTAVAEAAAADGTGAAVKVLTDGGRALGEHDRYGVLRTLQAWRDTTDAYPPAAGLAGELYRAWLRAYGDQPPRAA